METCRPLPSDKPSVVVKKEAPSSTAASIAAVGLREPRRLGLRPISSSLVCSITIFSSQESATMKQLRTSRKGRRKQHKRSSSTLVGAWTLVFLVSVLRVLPCSSAESSIWRRLRTASQFHRRSSAGAELVGSKLTNSTAELLVAEEEDETRLSAAEKRISALSPTTAIYNSYGDSGDDAPNETTDDQNNNSLWSRRRSRKKLSRKRARERFLERVALIASSSDLVHDADILGGALMAIIIIPQK